MRERNPNNLPDYCLVYKGKYILRKGTRSCIVERANKIPLSCKKDYQVKHISECACLADTTMVTIKPDEEEEGEDRR